MSDERAGQSPTPDEVISALSRTGFLLESRAARILRKIGLDVRINDAFPDPESGKSREVDVFAAIDHEIKRPPVELSVSGEVIVECKSGTAPFILIGERGQSKDAYESIHYEFDPFRLNFPGKRMRTVVAELGLYSPPGFRAAEDFAGYQLIRMNRASGAWRADNNSVYDSILYPLIKAVQYRIDLDKGVYDPEDKDVVFRPWRYPHILYVFPVVLTAGQVYTVDVSDDDPQVNVVPWACLTRSFSSKDLNISLWADVVSFEYFENFLKSRVITPMDHVKNTLAANVHLYDPEWLSVNMGQPEDNELFTSWLNDIRATRRPPPTVA